MESRKSIFFLGRATLLLRAYAPPFLHPFHAHSSRACSSSAGGAPKKGSDLPLLQKLNGLGIREGFTLQPRSSSSLVEKIDLLLKQGLSVEHINRFLQKCGDAVFYNSSLQQVESVLTVFKTMHIQKETLGRILIRHPQIICTSPKYLESKLRVLESLGVPPEEFGKCFEKCPRAFLISDRTCNERLEFWKSLGISNKSLRKMLQEFPQLLGFNIERKVRPLIAHFESYGVSKAVICSNISRHPQCFGLSMANLSHKMEFLQQLGFERNSRRILMVYFQLFSYTPRILQSRVDWLISEGFSMEEVRDVVQRCPTILGLSIENIRRKLDYYLNVQKRTKEEIVHYPLCLAFSLEKRLIPRFAILAERQQQGSLSLQSPLVSILQDSDLIFQKRLCSKQRRSLPASHKVI